MRIVRLVAAREFGERVRSKAFIVSNLVIVALLVLSVLVPLLLVEDAPERIGHLGGQGEAVVRAAATQEDAFDLEIEAVALEGRAAAEQALREGEVDAVVVDRRTVLVQQSLSRPVEALLASAATSMRINEELAEAGIDAEQRESLFRVEPLRVEVLSERKGPADVTSPSVIVTYFAVFLLFGLLAIYGQWVAQGIVEEKQSRVVEVLLSSIRPTELLAGKIAGLGLLGLAQVVLMGAVGVTGLLLTDSIDLTADGWRSLALVVPWYVLGFLLYAVMFAMAGAVVARVEDLQSAVMPVAGLLVLALLTANIALGDPHSPVATVAGIVPFTAPIMQPILLALGASSTVEVVLAIVLAVAAIAALIPLAGRIYRGGVLRTRGKVSYREAWGAARGR